MNRLSNIFLIFLYFLLILLQWIAKDLSWAQDNLVAGMFFGSCAVAWLCVLAYLAFRDKYIEEAYMLIALSLWLLGKHGRSLLVFAL